MPQDTGSIHSDTAKREPRGEHGEFASTHIVAQNTPSLTSRIWDYLSKISLKKLITTMGLISIIATNGLSLTLIERLFPHSSPIFHRQVAHQGILNTSGGGIYTLTLTDNSVYTLNLKPSGNLKNLKNLNEVVVRGNLTFTPYLIDNAEIYPVNISTTD